jgi:hypothetical protein
MGTICVTPMFSLSTTERTMTYNENRNAGYKREPLRNAGENRTIWIVGLIGLAIIAAVVVFAGTDNSVNTATDSRPAATAPATTTGSGSNADRPAVQPANPAGNVPTAPPAGSTPAR